MANSNQKPQGIFSPLVLIGLLVFSIGLAYYLGVFLNDWLTHSDIWKLSKNPIFGPRVQLYVEYDRDSIGFYFASGISFVTCSAMYIAIICYKAIPLTLDELNLRLGAYRISASGLVFAICLPLVLFFLPLEAFNGGLLSRAGIAFYPFIIFFVPPLFLFAGSLPLYLIPLFKEQKLRTAHKNRNRN